MSNGLTQTHIYFGNRLLNLKPENLVPLNLVKSPVTCTLFLGELLLSLPEYILMDILYHVDDENLCYVCKKFMICWYSQKKSMCISSEALNVNCGMRFMKITTFRYYCSWTQPLVICIQHYALIHSCVAKSQENIICGICFNLKYVLSSNRSIVWLFIANKVRLILTLFQLVNLVAIFISYLLTFTLYTCRHDRYSPETIQKLLIHISYLFLCI